MGKEGQHRHTHSKEDSSIESYAATIVLSSWVENALDKYQPREEVSQLVKPFATDHHDFANHERKCNCGLHHVDPIKRTYQYALQIGAAILLAADKTDDPVDLALHLHPSRAGLDDHLSTWGTLLTGLECDPPIIAQLPLYLLMCQAFSFEPTSHSARDDFVFSALTSVDWVSFVLLLLGINLNSARRKMLLHCSHAPQPSRKEYLSFLVPLTGATGQRDQQIQ